MKPHLLQGFTAAAAAVLLAGSAAAQAPEPPFDLADAARIDVGKARFTATCAGYCHGAEGVGGKAPSFKGNEHFSAPLAFKVISQGRRGAGVMPPWANTFTPEQIWELVAYLQHLAKQPAN